MNTQNRITAWLSVAALISCAVLAGAMLGGLYVKLFVPKTGMGWDQMADALGGLMVGGLAQWHDPCDV